MIPESLKLGGTYRSLSPDGLYFLQRRIKEVRSTVIILTIGIYIMIQAKMFVVIDG